MMTKKELPLRKLLKFRNAWVAWGVFLVSVIATILLWQLSIRLVEDRTEARFRTQSLQLRTAIEERLLNYERSEERRVGKECRSRWLPDCEKTKTKRKTDPRRDRNGAV